MKKIKIYIEINGERNLVGYILGDSYLDACFQYAEEYLNSGHFPISVSLPLQKEAFSPDKTKSFFEGLLPEGFSRKAVCAWAKSDETDYLSILECLGKECLGAISVGDALEADSNFYQKLSMEQVQKLAAEGATTSTQILVDTHLSLTGATGKVGLYFDEGKDNWYLPIGNLASTHIVKQSHVRYQHIVLNELLCMRAAEKIGITVPKHFVINTGNYNDRDILYATKRYDRILGEEQKGELLVPYRLHQEDFAQALGISAHRKYETQKNDYLAKSFQLITDFSAQPIEDQVELWKRVLFQVLIGNTDGHIKNWSLLYQANMDAIRLSPAYDILCTTVYQSNHMMSMYYGEKVRIEDIDRDSILGAAQDAKLGERFALRQLDEMLNVFENCLTEASYEAEEIGFESARELEDQILQTSGYHNFL